MVILVDRLVVRAMLAGAVAAALMLANRWQVATEQAGVLEALLTGSARMAAAHFLREHRGDGALAEDAEHIVKEVVSLSTHHLAAVVVVSRGEVIGHPRDQALDHFLLPLAAPGMSLDGVHFDALGKREEAHLWRMLPHASVIELDAGDGHRLRVLVSLQLARENQYSIFVQAVKSVILALAVVLATVLLILRQPRRHLVEAGDYAARLPFEQVEPLPSVKSGLAAVDTLRDSLNKVGQLLEERRLQRRIDEHSLQQAAREAQAATQAKSSFLAHMSHEIRTLLNGVLGLTRLVLDTPLPELQRQHLKTAHQSADNLLQIVNKVLDLSRMEAGKLHLESVPFSLYAVLDEACKPFGLPAAK